MQDFQFCHFVICTMLENVVELKNALIFSLYPCREFGNPYCGVVLLFCCCSLAVLPCCMVIEAVERFINTRSGLLHVVAAALLRT